MRKYYVFLLGVAIGCMLTLSIPIVSAHSDDIFCSVLQKLLTQNNQQLKQNKEFFEKTFDGLKRDLEQLREKHDTEIKSLREKLKHLESEAIIDFK